MLAQIAWDPGADQEGADHRGSQDDLAGQRDGPPAVQDVRRCRRPGTPPFARYHRLAGRPFALRPGSQSLRPSTPTATSRLRSYRAGRPPRPSPPGSPDRAVDRPVTRGRPTSATRPGNRIRRLAHRDYPALPPGMKPPCWPGCPGLGSRSCCPEDPGEPVPGAATV